jgi:hypothetical protein
LQSVDEAIIKRATTLEISSAELNAKSQEMLASIEQLQLSTGNLSDGLGELREQTRALEDIANNHGSLINSLQKANTEIRDRFAVINKRENKHFTMLTAGLWLLLVAVAVMYFAQQYQFGINDSMLVERSGVLDRQISDLQQTQNTSTLTMSDSLTALQDKIEDEVVRLDKKMQTMNDRVQSVDGRLSQSSPFSLIGNDNIIHGAQWIKDLPADNFVVQLAYVDNMKDLYEIAQRYNYYLKDALSYFKVEDGGKTEYVLLSGNYATQVQASAQMQALPRYINRQQPVVKKLEDVQKYIAEN